MLPSLPELLSSRRFLPLFVTQFLGAFNDNILKNALVILITYKMTALSPASSQLLVTAAAGIFILPFFLFSATAGKLADMREKSQLIRWVKLAEVAIMVLAAIGFAFSHISLLMGTLFLMGVHSTFFGPLKYAVLPQHLAENELIRGNGLIEAGTFLAILLGTIAGGVLIMVEPGGSYIVSGLLLLVAGAGLVSAYFVPEAKAAEHIGEKPALSWNMVAETAHILGYAKKERGRFLAILGISSFWLVGATYLSQFPVYAKTILHGNEHSVTLLLTVFSIGIGIGSVLCSRLLRGEVSVKYVPVAALGLTLFGVDLFFASRAVPAITEGSAQLIGIAGFLSSFSYLRVLCDLLAVAICGGVYIVPLYTYLQVSGEASHRSRLIAANNIMNALFMVIAAVGTAVLLLLHFSIPVIFLLIALLNLGVALYICMLLPDTLIKSSLRKLLSLVYRVDIRGMEHYEAAGKRVLIVANHTSFLDAVLLAVFLPGRCTFAINAFIAELWWIKPFLSIVDAFPMDPTNPMATKSFIEELRKDKHGVIFPEGRITVTGALMKIYEGPGMIADKADAAILPIRIEGAQYTPLSRLKGKVRLRWFVPITISIMPAVRIGAAEALKGRARRRYIGRRLYDIMSDMMFQTADYHKPLFHSLLDAMRIHGGHHKILTDVTRKEMSYRQFLIRTSVLAGAVTRQTARGEYVGVMLPNMSITVVLFFALQLAGRVPAMLNFTSGIAALQSACKGAQIRTIYTSRKFIASAKLEQVAEALTEAGVKLVYMEEVRDSITLMGKLKGAVHALSPMRYYAELAGEVKPEDPAVVLFTSGSEGTPKGVVLSHENIQSNRCQLSARVDFGARDIVFNVLPLFHSFGLTAGTLLPILAGIKIFLYPTPLHYRIIPELIYDVNATIMFGTDTFLSGYARFAHPYDFYSLRYVFAGAERLKEETRKTYAERFGVRVFEGYGATETSPVLSVNTPMHNKPGTVGRLLPGMEAQLTPVPGIEEGGRLEVKGPNVMLGYLRESNPGVVEDLPLQEGGRWYDTGDIVTIDEEGFIAIKGRAKRFAKIGGEMVSLSFVEEAVSRIFPEGQHAVVAKADEKKGEQLILLTSNKEVSKEALISFGKEQGLSELSIPKKIVYIEALPLLATGKVDYRQLGEMAE